MYGRWFLIAFGFGLLVLFVIGMIATAYAPIFAVGIALLIAAFLLAGMATRRGSQVGSERTSAAQERREAGQGARATASASPRGGEGEAGQAHRAPLTGGGHA
jgi:membrane protein implicated in regulation of membrane protease activity